MHAGHLLRLSEGISAVEQGGDLVFFVSFSFIGCSVSCKGGEWRLVLDAFRF